MKPRICILLNNLNEFNFSQLLYRYLPNSRFDVEILEKFPDDPKKFQLIIPWNYKKIIKHTLNLSNVVILHSSDLPEGRGWAPIYYSFQEKKTEYVISAILAASKVDEGEIILRARFTIEDSYTASFLRGIDEELSLIMIAKIIERWPCGKIVGVRQSGNGTYRPRRHPKDNEIDIGDTLNRVLPHLRGVEKTSPAFFFLNEVKYIIEVRPEFEPNKPRKVTFEYPATNEVDYWTDWA